MELLTLNPITNAGRMKRCATESKRTLTPGCSQSELNVVSVTWEEQLDAQRQEAQVAKIKA